MGSSDRNATAPAPAGPREAASPGKGRCLLCAEPSPDSICPACKAHVEGEARERRRREMGGNK